MLEYCYQACIPEIKEKTVDMAVNGCGVWDTARLLKICKASVIVDKTAGFLHDGRARTLIEAILWHDGEAAQSRQRLLAMSAKERKALIRFVESL